MFSEIYDISWPLRVKMPVFPGGVPYRATQSLFLEKGDRCNLSSFESSMHNGTHVDAPVHFVSGGKSINDLNLRAFFGKARVVLVETETEINSSHLEGMKFHPGERLLLKNPRNEELLAKEDFSPDFVGLDQSAAQFLADHSLALVGTEYLSIENSRDNSREVHKILLGAEVILLEGIDLRRVEPGEYFLACAPLKLENGNGSPVRAVLLR